MGRAIVRAAVGVPDGWLIPGHIVAGRHGPVRRRPLAALVSIDQWDRRLDDA